MMTTIMSTFYTKQSNYSENTAWTLVPVHVHETYIQATCTCAFKQQ